VPGPFPGIFILRKKMIKLVAFDLDGTVVDHKNTPTPSTLESIRKMIDEGVHVASISGRSVSNSQRPFLLHTDYADDLLVGSYNGAVALDRVREGGRRPLHEQRMPDDRFRDIIQVVKQAGWNYIYCRLRLGPSGVEAEDYTALRKDKTIDDMVLQTGTEFLTDADLTDKIESKSLGVPPKILICPGEDARESVYAELKEAFGGSLYIERTDIDRVEAMHPDVNKARALNSICAACGVGIDEAMAIGDGSNDLSMLEAASVGVLLGNADEKTKAMAVNVEHGDPFEENGFTSAVEKFVFGR